MRLLKFHIVLLFSLLLIKAAAQTTVPIKDTAFAGYLKTLNPPVLDQNGQLIVSAARSYTGKIDCNGKGIRSAEGIQYFSNISSLNLNNNDELDTLPDLSALTKLIRLEANYTRIAYLPGVDKLRNLQVLYAWKTRIRFLPDLSALTALTDLRVFYTELKAAPVLGSKPRLKTIYLNDNRITSLPDFTGVTVLENVRLYHNPLTFRELLKLTPLPRYDTIFKLNPQEPLRVAYQKTVSESDTLILTTGIDRGVADVTYEWFRNSTRVHSSSADTLVIPASALKDSGFYVCRIKHPAFPQVTLFTDSFAVKVLPCLDPARLSYSATDITCLGAATVQIAAGQNGIRSYNLISESTGRIFSSQSGSFTGLSENSYLLQAEAQNGCRKQAPFKVKINRKECEEVLISPGQEGASGSYFFEDTGRAVIYDKRGNVVRTLTIPAEWDGTSDKGKVFTGFYVADVNNGSRLIGITVLQ